MSVEISFFTLDFDLLVGCKDSDNASTIEAVCKGLNIKDGSQTAKV